MNKKTKQVIAITAALVVSPVAAYTGATPAKKTNVTSTKTNAKPNTKAKSKKQAKVSEPISIALTDVNQLLQDDNNIVTYTLTYTNNTSKSVPLSDYGTKVTAKGKLSYVSKRLSSDESKKIIPAEGKVSLTFHTVVDKSIKAEQLEFIALKWDMTKPPHYEQIIKKISGAPTQSMATPYGKSKKIYMSDISVSVNVQGVEPFLTAQHHVFQALVDVHNTSVKTLEKVNIKSFLRTASGHTYPLTTTTHTGEQTTSASIAAQHKKTLKCAANLPKNVNLQGAHLVLAQEDIVESKDQGMSKKLIYPLATFQLAVGKTTNKHTSPRAEVIIKLDNDDTLHTSVQGVARSQSHGQSDYMISFRIANTSAREVTVPKYTFTLQNDKGDAYPIATKALDNVKLKPKEERLLSLSTAIPTDAVQGTLHLHMNQPGPAATTKDGEAGEANESARMHYPVARYALSEVSSMNGSLGVEHTKPIGSQKIGITWKTLQRLPWKNGKDLISARLTVRNLSNSTIKLPPLSGKFTLDVAEMDDTKTSKSNNSGMLGALASTDVVVYAEVASSLQVSQIQLSLAEKYSKDHVNDLIKLTHAGEIPTIPKRDKHDSHTFTTAEQLCDIKIKRTLVYPGTSSDIVYTELHVKNNERRHTNLASLVGYYQAANGQYYKAAIQQIQEQVAAGETAIVTIMTKIPHTTTVSDMHLILGTSVNQDNTVATESSAYVVHDTLGETEETKNDKTETQATPAPQNSATAYVDAVALALDPQRITTANTIESIDWFPYKITTRDFKANVHGGAVTIEWNYDMKKQESMAVADQQRKLIVEIVDPFGKTTTHELDLNKDMKEGNGQSATWSAGNISIGQSGHQSYRINIYDQVQGHKIKLATQWKNYIMYDVDEKEK